MAAAIRVPHLRHNHHMSSYIWEDPNMTYLLINTNYSTTPYITTDSPLNITISPYNTPNPHSQVMYLYIPSILIFLCAISIAINFVILTSVYWIRGRISPTLHISLSLAGADTFTLVMFAFGLVINSLLPRGLDVHYFDTKRCFALFIESLRLGGIMTTMLHLLALAGNHYLGILSPLHYPSYMTRRNIHYCALLLWLIPSTFLIIYFSTLKDEGFSAEGCPWRFMLRTKFRTEFSMVFFACLLVLIFIYAHIFTLVRRHQESRMRYRTTGNNYSRSQANEKAILTTLLIVGSVIIGWLPAVCAFYLSCEDCMFKLNWGEPITEMVVRSILQALIICKNASNTYIYAFRMKEIKLAIRCMRAQLFPRCGGPAPNRWSSEHMYSQSSTRRTRRSVVCRLHSFPDPPGNGSLSAQRNGSQKSTIRLHSYNGPPEGEKDSSQTISQGDSKSHENFVNTSL